VEELGLKLDQLDTPVLWVDLDGMEENIRVLAGYFRRAGVNWRPHIKGIKVPAIARKLMDAGAAGITCAKLGEAEVMAFAGIKDILIANQIVGIRKYGRLIDLCRIADVIIAVDSDATIPDLRQAAVSGGVEIGIVVELDSGMKRAGIRPGEPALELSRMIHESKGLRYLGLMTWEGHTVRMEDPASKRREIEKSLKLLLDTAGMCREAGLPVAIVSCGGSATYAVASHVPGVTEIQAGGAVFCDVSYKKWGAGTEPALFVRSTVTSRPASGRIICDAGFKAMPGWMNTPRPAALSFVDKMEASAEHGVIHLTQGNDSIKVGDTLDFIPAYGDITVFLHDYLYGIRKGTVEVVWPVEARGKIR